MRKFLFVFLFCSCSLFNDYSWVGIENIDTEEKAIEYLKENIIYEKDIIDYWQFPEETYELGRGDCEDMAALLAHLFIYNVGLDNVSLVGCIRRSDNQPHMMVKVGYVYYEAAPARLYPYYHERFYTISNLSLENYIDLARFYHL